MRRFTAVLAVSIVLMSASQSDAEILYNDNWQDLAQVAIQLGNCGGECDAVVLEPNSYPFEVNYVYAIGSGAGGGGGSLVADVKILGVDGSDQPDLDDELGGLEAADVELSGAQWFEISLGLGTPAVIESGKFAVAFCFYSEEPFEPCNYVGLGCDSGPMVTGGGYVYANIGQTCAGFQQCIELFPADYNWYTNATLGLNRNWIIRASDTQWSPEQGDDDDAGDDDTADDDTGDDDAGDDDSSAADDDTSLPDDDVVADVKVESIEPAQIDQGDTSRFVVSGTGFQDELDVFLGNVRVSQVDVENDVEIEGIFPAELTVGPLDVCVENPDGGADCLLQGLTVMEQEEEPPVTNDCDCSVAGAPARTAAAVALGALVGVALLGYRRR